MKIKHDIIIIGAGSAGLSVSLFTGKAGLKTLLIEKNEHTIGGDCLNFGCVPSKAMIHVSKILHNAKAAEQFGLTVSGIPDVSRIMRYISSKQDHIRKHENSTFLKEQGIDVVIGEASFHDKHTISVNGKHYRAKKIVIATGSKPKHPDIKGIEKIALLDNESIFNLKELPKKILIIGAGPVGIEMAQALTRMGCQVTVIGRNTEILPNDPPEITRILKNLLIEEGIEFYTGFEVNEFIDEHHCIIRSPNGEEKTIAFNTVFVATGRNLSIQSLRLENAGIETKDNLIVRDNYLRTTNKNVFVCGDVAGSLMFSHAAEQHARILLNNFFSPFKNKLDNNVMSWVTFTDPQVATFGSGEPYLKEKGLAYEKIVFDFEDDDRAVVDDYQYGKVILYATKKSLTGKQKILGGSMVAPMAGEMIQELILIRNESLSTDVLFQKIYPYPVASRVNQLVIVREKEKGLTSFVKKLIRVLYRILS